VTYVTGAAILAHVKGSAYSGTSDETAWAGKCADAIEAAIAARLDGDTPSAGGVDELEVAALQDGAALYNSKAGPTTCGRLTRLWPGSVQPPASGSGDYPCSRPYGAGLCGLRAL
jgi:hypothetical protein